MTDGSIKISTRLDNSQLESDFQGLRTMIAEHGGKAEQKLNRDLDRMVGQYEKVNDKLREQQEIIKRVQHELNLTTKLAGPEQPLWGGAKRRGLEEELRNAQIESEKLEQQISLIADGSDRMAKSLNESAEATRETTQQTEKLGEATSKVEKKSKLNLKTIARYAGYLIGMRAVYSGIMKAVNSWYRTTEEGARVQAQLQGVWTALGQTLAPIITKLVGLLRTALGYINAITKGLFGFSLFSKQATKNLSGAVGKAKELRKQLSGFDEMNILQDDGSVSGGDTGLGALDFDEPDLSWLQRLKPIIDSLVETFGKLWDIIKKVAQWLWDKFISGLEFFTEIIADTDIEVGDLIATLLILYGVFKLIQLLAGTSPLGWVVIAIIAIIVILGVLRDNWDKVKEAFSNGFATFKELLNEQLDSMWLWGTYLRELGESIWLFFKGIFNAVKLILGGVIDFILGVFTGDWERAWQGVTKILEGIWEGFMTILKAPFNFVASTINTIISGLNKISIPKWLGGKGEKVNIPLIPKLAKGTVVSKPLTAEVGDAGREAIVPLERNLEWADNFLDVLESRGGMGGTGEIINIIQIDGKEVARTTRKLNQDDVFRNNGGLKYGY